MMISSDVFKSLRNRGLRLGLLVEAVDVGVMVVLVVVPRMTVAGTNLVVAQRVLFVVAVRDTGHCASVHGG
jgi:hypothetical protein